MKSLPSPSRVLSREEREKLLNRYGDPLPLHGFARAMSTLRALGLVDLYAAPSKRDTKEWLEDFAHSWRTVEEVPFDAVLVRDASLNGWAVATAPQTTPVRVQVLSSFWPLRCYVSVQLLGGTVERPRVVTSSPITRGEVPGFLERFELRDLRWSFDYQRRFLPAEWAPDQRSAFPESWVVVADGGASFRVSRDVHHLSRALGLLDADGVIGRLKKQHRAWGPTKWTALSRQLRRELKTLLSRRDPVWMKLAEGS